jgi:hypothetical protein
LLDRFSTRRRQAAAFLRVRFERFQQLAAHLASRFRLGAKFRSVNATGSVKSNYAVSEKQYTMTASAWQEIVDSSY